MKKTAFILALAMLLCGIAPAAVSADNPSLNSAPRVIPAIREWNPSTGKFVPKKGMRIVLTSGTRISDELEKIISGYFSDIVGIEISFVTEDAQSGDIILTLSAETPAETDDARISALGNEGYIIDVNETANIFAFTSKGLLYGIITILQSYIADGFMPCGEVYDYPSYPIRSGMIDIARAYVPLEYVEEITKYFAWFKLNEIHLHINDTGSDGIGYFRLESDVPGLTSDEHYTKAEYREYQKRMLEYGVEVVTEIDTPAHSACFSKAVPQYMFDGHHIDITNPDAVGFICNLWDEYITGDDPVFVSKTVHFGTDEFPDGYNEQMRAFTDTLIKHLRSRGCTPRFWGSFGGKGFNGETPVSGDAQTNFWAVELSDYKTLFKMGYDVINTCGPVLYCVPGGNYGFANYYDLRSLYSTWFVNYMGYNASTSVKYDHPQLKGASFALWNDLWCDWGGFSIFDIFDRLRYQICLISEKTWCGEQTREISADDFISRFDILSTKSGGSNPGRHEALPIDQTNATGIKSVGYPYQLTANINISDYDTDLFSGGDGRLYVSNTGRLCFDRESYTFTYGAVIPKNTDVKIQLYADRTRTMLIVDDTWYYSPVNSRNLEGDKKGGSTFVLPLERVSSSVQNFEISEHTFDISDMLYNANLALGKKVTVSGLEVDYGLNEPLAVDGNTDTRLSFARDKDEQWMIVDLGTVREINKVIIRYFERVSAYEIYVSEDGENYKKVYDVSGLEEGTRGAADTVEFNAVNARYVKYVQLKRWYCADYSTYYSGGITEFEVYGPTPDHTELMSEAEMIDDSAVRTAVREINNYLKRKEIYAPHINGLYNALALAVDNYKNPPVSSPEEPSSEADSSGAVTSDSSSNSPETSPNAIMPIAIGAAILAAAGVLIAVLKKRKK